VDAIPASHCLGIEVLEKPGGKPSLDFLVRTGENLPKKGRKVFRAAESLRAGENKSLNFKIWEGAIENPISDNRPIGVLKISGQDFIDSVIPIGADLVCDYEILESGNINLVVTVPCITGTFRSGRNFYSPQEGQIDFTQASLQVAEEGHRTLQHIDQISRLISDPKLDLARQKLQWAAKLKADETQTDQAQEALEKVYSARRLLADVRIEHASEIRRIDLANAVQCFERYNRPHASAKEALAFDELVQAAQKSIEQNEPGFEHHYDQLLVRNFHILWRQDWYVIDNFNRLMASAHQFPNQSVFETLIKEGQQLVKNDQIKELRKIVSQLAAQQIRSVSDTEPMNPANIVRA
jgi:molecular chaperone DnaK